MGIGIEIERVVGYTGGYFCVGIRAGNGELELELAGEYEVRANTN